MTVESKRGQRSKTRVRVRVPTATYEALKIISRVRGENLDATVNRAVAAYITSAKERQSA